MRKNSIQNDGPLAAAVRLLARRSLSEKELKQKLSLKGYSFASIDDTVTELIRRGYLNENEAKRDALLHLVESKKYGLWMINEKLKQKGFTVSEAEIREVFPLEAEISVARKIIERKGHSGSESLSLAQSIRILQQRGFSSPSIFEWKEKWQELSCNAALLDTFDKKNYN